MQKQAGRRHQITTIGPRDNVVDTLSESDTALLVLMIKLRPFKFYELDKRLNQCWPGLSVKLYSTTVDKKAKCWCFEYVARFLDQRHYREMGDPAKAICAIFTYKQGTHRYDKLVIGSTALLLQQHFSVARWFDVIDMALHLFQIKQVCSCLLRYR